MVFFTCNHCGESLKKPVVDKHYQWKSCKGATPFLTCVDCLKDFRGEEYRAHTKCVSELEKYSAKGFVAKADKNKGAKKQEIWIEVIQNLQEKPGLDSSIKFALEKIATNSNVPRKKQKFLNFIKSSMRMSPNNSEKLWSIIEIGLKDYEQVLAEKKGVKQKETSNADAVVQSTEEKKSLTENGAKEETDGQPKKKKKKNQNGTADETDNPAKENGISKKKKKEIENDTTDDTDGQPKKKKKKLQNGTNDETDSQPKEKKKDENGINDETNGLSKKKKKKNENGSSEETNKKTAGSTESSSSGFDWKIQILNIVSKKSEINIEKLKSKVLKKYAAKMNNAEITHKINKTFQKHIKKMKTISIKNDIVKLTKS